MSENAFGRGAIAVPSRLCDTLSIHLTVSKHPIEIVLTIGDPNINGVENVKCRM